MDGFIFVNKEVGCSSYDVIRKLKRILGMKKMGHIGTLDPLASGLMIICLGKATKFANLFDSHYKFYEMVVALGFETDTLDLAGKVVKRGRSSVTLEEIERALSKFANGYNQIPPKFSAVKYQGKRAYKLAANGKEFELGAKRVEIKDLQFKTLGSEYIHIRAAVSKGTYLRSLARDISHEIGSFGTALAISRTEIGPYSIDDSFSLDQIREMVENNYHEYVKPLDTFFTFEEVDLSEDERWKYINGVKIKRDKDDGLYRIMFNCSFIGYGKIDNNLLQLYKFMVKCSVK